jgi:hypothetical protein
VAIFAVGLAVFAGLMLAPRNKPPPAPAGVPWGAPPQSVSVVACDLSGRQVTMEALGAEIRAAAKASGAAGDSPDFLVLQHVGADDTLALARVMGMQASYRSQHHQRVRGAGGGGASEFVGVGLLSKHALYEGVPLRIDKKHSAGVSAVAVVGASKFRVACVYAADAEGAGLTPLLEQQEADGHPPALLGLAGDAGAGAHYRKMLAAEFAEVAPADAASGISLLATRHWRVLSAGTGGGVKWYVVGGQEPASGPATRSTG